MRSRPVPLALLTALGFVALCPGSAPAQQYFNSMRPNFYTPSNFSTPNASMYRPSNFGNSGVSFGMPNPYRYMPNLGALSSGTATPLGVVHTLPGTLITGVNFGGPPAANLPLPPEGGPISVNVPPQPSAAMLNALPPPAEQQVGPPAPENPAAPPAGAPPTEATSQAGYGTQAGATTYVPNALTTPGAAPAPAAPFAAPSRSAAPAPAAAYTPSYGTFAPAPQYPASIASALNRVFGPGH
jgi:hypothetical protein